MLSRIKKILFWNICENNWFHSVSPVNGKCFSLHGFVFSLFLWQREIFLIEIQHGVFSSILNQTLHSQTSCALHSSVLDDSHARHSLKPEFIPLSYSRFHNRFSVQWFQSKHVICWVTLEIHSLINLLKFHEIFRCIL